VNIGPLEIAFDVPLFSDSFPAIGYRCVGLSSTTSHPTHSKLSLMAHLELSGQTIVPHRLLLPPSLTPDKVSI
jgi:hypothetical protein